MLRLLWLLFMSAVLSLAGCGGGSSDTTTTGVAPTLSSQPTSQSVIEGATVSLGVGATGTGTLGYQWRKGGSALSGATSATYQIAAATAADSGDYDVIVSNAYGSVISAVATLTVSSASGAPLIATQPASQSVVAGTGATFSVSVTGTAPLTYQWRKNGTAIGGATSASFSIAAVVASDAGSYDVVISNEKGSATSTAAVLSVTTTASGAQSVAATTAAQEFLATLSSTQQSQTQLAWSLDSARRWSNLPAAMVSRNGVSWGSLNSTQQTAARTLITTALGSTGNTLHLGLQAADDYLYANGGGSSYGAGQYYIAILGTPSSTGFWMLQLTGHHLTFNIAFNGSYRSATPLFLGIEPKASFTQSGSTLDPMAAQRNAFSDLGTALTGYAGAKLSGTYSDLLFGANGSGNIDGTCPRTYGSVTERGLLYGALSSTHQALVKEAIRTYVNTQSTEYADDLLGSYLSDTALAQTYVAYAGAGTITGNGSYFRLDGPRLWIEFSVQRGVIFGTDIHYHTIWRDKVADYGGKCAS